MTSSDIRTQPALERPFYFIMVLWGERFRDYFLRLCLPSLLAPGNLPSLSTRAPSKFLIATCPDDWAAMQAAPIFTTLKNYVEPVYLEIPPCPANRSGYQHMSIGHRIACDMAHRDKAYATVLTPDCMLSEGSVVRLQALARDGVQLVLTAALRFGEEPFLANLRELGVLPDDDAHAGANPVVVAGRQMAYASVNGFHSETLAYEWDTPGIMAISPAAWWRVPGEDGIVLHSLSWAPLLLDYAAIDDHDMSTFAQWTLDGDYVFKHAENFQKIHVVQDSDELFIASWGPMTERAISKTRFPFDKLLAGHFFKQSFYSGFFDPLKRKLFFLPVRWHARPLNEKWAAVEQHAMRELVRWVTPNDDAAGEDRVPTALQRLHDAAAKLPLSILRPIAYSWIFRHRIGQLASRMLRGDHETFARVAWFARSFVMGQGRKSQSGRK